MANGLLDGLVAYWKHDEASGDVLDAHGTFPLSESAAMADVASGQRNSARDYNGRVASFASTTGTDLDARNSPMTSWSFSLWVKIVTANAVGGTWLIEQYDSGAGAQGWGCSWRHHTDDTVAVFYLDDQAATQAVATAAAQTLNDGAWHLICGGFDADSGDLWVSVDGSTIETATTTDPIETTVTTTDFTLGNNESFASFSDHYIDEAGFWNVALTQAKVDDLWVSGSGLPYSSFDSAATSGGEDCPNYDVSDPAPFFSRNLEITNHLKANFLNTADAPAVVNIVYRQVPL